MSVWTLSSAFNIAVLDTVVRPTDEVFAKLRVRTHSTGTAILASDVEVKIQVKIVKSCETGEDSVKNYTLV